MAGDRGLNGSFFYFWLHFWSILDGFGWLIGTPGFTVGTHWLPLGDIGDAGSPLVLAASSLGWLGSSLTPLGGHLVTLWLPGASKMNAASDQADIAKTCENHCFSMVLDGWRVIVEDWRSSGLSCWHTG